MLATTRDWDVALGRGFAIAAEALGSSVERIPCNVYDASPERIGGRVDVAFSGAIMLHLRDPVRALERIFDCLEPGGEIVILEPFSIRQTVLAPRRPAAVFRADVSDFNWWIPNLAGLRAWLVAAGFVEVERRGFHHPPARPEMRSWYVGMAARRPR
jgi:tRNA (mo5U34)-methyltransferase